MALALEQYLKPPVANKPNIPRSLESDPRYQELLRLERLRAELRHRPQLGVENLNGERLYQEMRDQLCRLSNDEQGEIMNARLAQYPKIDMRFLSMTQPRAYNDVTIQVPRFAIFAIDKPYSIIHPRCHWPKTIDDIQLFFTEKLQRQPFDRWNADRLPKQIQRPFLQAALQMFELLPGDIEEISIAFAGLVPLEVHRRISTAIDALFCPSRINLVREVSPNQWRIHERPEPDYLDPLVIGHFRDTCYLIDRFDPTPLEAEFAI